MKVLFKREYDDPKSVKHLRLSSMGLDELDGSELLQFSNVEVLDLFENRLATLPNEINKLYHLRILRVNNNRLVIIPDLSNLTKLEEINITNNYLYALHPSILALPRLQNLYIGGNYILLSKYLSAKFIIHCASVKQSGFIDSTPSSMSLNLERCVTTDLMKLNSIYANKADMSEIDQYDLLVSMNGDIIKQSFDQMDELVSRSTTLIIEKNNSNIELLNANGIIVIEDEVQQTLRKINSYMFDLVDQIRQNYELNTRETNTIINKIEMERNSLQLKVRNLELTNEKLVEYNTKLENSMQGKTLKPKQLLKEQQKQKREQKEIMSSEHQLIRRQMTELAQTCEEQRQQLKSNIKSINDLKLENSQLKDTICDLEEELGY